jgi:hypothetical protein
MPPALQPARNARAEQLNVIADAQRQGGIEADARPERRDDE